MGFWWKNQFKMFSIDVVDKADADGHIYANLKHCSTFLLQRFVSQSIRLM